MLASWRENVFLIIGSSLPSIVVSTMKSAIHRSIDAKKEFPFPLIVQLHDFDDYTSREYCPRSKEEQKPWTPHDQQAWDVSWWSAITASYGVDWTDRDLADAFSSRPFEPQLLWIRLVSRWWCSAVRSRQAVVENSSRDANLQESRNWWTVCGLEPLAIVMQINSPARAATGAQINSVFKWRLCVDCLYHRSESLRLHNRG